MAYCKTLAPKSLYLSQWSFPSAHIFTNAGSQLQKGQNHRVRVRSGDSIAAANVKATSRREAVAQMRAAAIRAKWEAEQATRERLKGVIHPTSVYFASSFETPCIPFRDAVRQLQEAAIPEMYDCLENPLYAKVIALRASFYNY